MSPIDFVITWVDGSDADLAQARKQARMGSGHNRQEKTETVHKARGQRNNGEIYYLIASIIKYAPFVQRVYIVTDNQKPLLLDDFVGSGLCRPDLLHVVSHDVVFDGLDVARPTFNSLVIEAALWRIPGLAEQFVYFNDDMFLNAPLGEEDFFRNGRPVIHGIMKLPGGWRPRAFARNLLARFQGRTAPDSPTYGRAQEQGARLAGSKGRFLMADHNPHPLRRSTAEAFFAGRPDLLSRQMRHRFRHSSQFLPVALSNHLERRRHGAAFEPRKATAYIERGGSSAKLKRNLAAVRNATVPFGCVQSLEKFPPETRALIHATLREKFSAELPPSVLLAE